jgi:DNA-binding transcriptional MerR regulator
MTALRHGAKSAAAFRTISEVAEDLDVPQHVLRFWETKFSQVRPLKRGGGRRYYRPEDVELLRHIRDLLYTEGYTIKGVQRLLRESGGRGAEDPADGDGLTAAQRRELKALKNDLLALRDLLNSLKS